MSTFAYKYNEADMLLLDLQFDLLYTYFLKVRLQDVCI